ncbi:MAG: hypothetical protein HOK82_21960 [Rhodospirillaceae bacterium]|nr:hypothetical protein [Rhodospirillaceae bacterium]
MDTAERRMTYRVTSEWVALKRHHWFPSIDFLHPKTFSVDWENCVLVRSLVAGENSPDEALEFEFIGSNFRKDTPDLATGERLSAVPPQSLLSLSAPALSELYDRQTAIIYSGIRPWRGANAVYFRSIAVPFSNSTGELTYALVALSYKVTKDALRPDQVGTEFFEFCEGAWLPMEGLPEAKRAIA